MQETIARNIRTHRERLSWTQAQLAEAARIQIRTVQRAEAAQGLNAETLQAIAGALDVEIDDLREDKEAIAEFAALMGVEPEELTPELVSKRIAEELAGMIQLPVVTIESSLELADLWKVLAFDFTCEIRDERVQDAVAALKAAVVETRDVVGDVDAVTFRGCEKEVLRRIAELRTLGCAAVVGTHTYFLQGSNKKPFEWPVAHVLVCSVDAVPKILLLPKPKKFNFQHL